MPSLEVWEAGLLSESEDPMQEFVRHYIVSILRPVAEHVRELQNHVGNLQVNLSNVDVRTQDMKVDFDQHVGEVSDLKSQLSLYDGRLSKVEVDVSGCYEETYRVGSFFEQSKHSFSLLRADIDNCSVHFDGKFHGIDDLLERLQIGLEKCNGNIAEHDEHLVQCNDYLKALRNVHSQTGKDLETLSDNHNKNERAFTSFVKAFENRRGEDAANLGSLKEKTDLMEDILADANRNIQRQNDISQKNTADIQKVKSSLTAQLGTLDDHGSQQNRLDEATEAMKQLSDRVETVESLTRAIKNTCDADKIGAPGGVAETIQELQKKHAKFESIAKNLEEAQIRCLNQAKRSDSSSAERQADLRKFAERQDVIDRELLPNLMSFRQELTGKLESQANELRYTRASVTEHQHFTHQLQELVHATHAEIGSLKEHIHAIDENQFENRKNLQGMTRGFEASYRSVVLGENGMLAPKSPGTTPLIRSRPATASKLYSKESPTRPQRPIGSAPPSGRRQATETPTFSSVDMLDRSSTARQIASEIRASPHEYRSGAWATNERAGSAERVNESVTAG